MQRLRPWLKALLIGIMLVAGLIAVSAIMPAFGFLFKRRSREFNEAIVLNWNRAVCRILNLRLKVSGSPDRSAGLLVANHVSWLDIIVLGSLVPCLFVAKREVGDWPVIGHLARGIGTLFVKRGDTGQITATGELMVWQLRQGKRLLLFPEGTTTTGERVLRFHSKLFQPAQRAVVRVQAVALRYQGDARLQAPFVGEDEFLPHLLGILKMESIGLELSFCPILPAGLDRGEMAQSARQQIAALIDNPSPATDSLASRHLKRP